ncbi:MAG: glycosyltransferase family 4 protein [Nevskiales bacterium]
MKVCHINLARGFRGGERQTELLIEALAGMGVSQRLVMRRGSPMAAHLHGVPGLELCEIGQPFVLHASSCRGCDLVHVHEAHAAYVALAAHWCWRLPYILTRRVDAPPGGSWINRKTYERAGIVVAISENVRAVLLGVMPQLPITMISSTHSGLAATAVPDAPANLPHSESVTAALRWWFAKKFVVGHAGALVNRHKGQLYLIEAARLLRERCPDLAVLLLGSGEDEAMLRAAAEGLDSVVFAGFQNDLGDWFSMMQVFAFPSLYEGLGSVVLDAMNHGLPVVGSRVGGIPEIVKHEVNGLLVPPGDAAALAAALQRLYDDAELRVTLAEGARLTADRYAPAAMAQAYLVHYQHCLGAAPRPA